MIQVGNLSTCGVFSLPSFCDAIGKNHGILNGLMSASTNGKMLWWWEKHWGFGGDTKKKNLLSTDKKKIGTTEQSNLDPISGGFWGFEDVEKKRCTKENASNPAWPCIIFTMSLGCFLCFFLAELDSVRKPDDDCQLQGELPKKNPFKLFISSFVGTRMES